jgi:hypothetical protein
MDSDLTHTYLGSNIVAIPEQPMRTASLINSYLLASTRYYFEQLITESGVSS